MLVGRAARAQRERWPAHTIYEAKRFIGKTFDEVAAAGEQGRFPFRVVNDSGQPVFQVIN